VSCILLVASVLQAQTVEEQYILSAQQDREAFVQSNLWVTTELDRTTCYVGEPVVVGYYLYTRLRSNSRISKRPALNGFSVYDMNTIADQEPVVVQRKGQYFYQHLIRKVQVYAMQAGRYRIDPVEIDNTIQFVVEGLQMEGAEVASPYTYLARSDEQWIDVKPLPGNDSAVTTAVGQFSLQMRTKGLEPIRAGDPFTLEMVLEGSGNLALLPPPTVVWPAGWTLISTAAVDEWSTLQSPLTGKKIFRYTLIAPQSQPYTIPAARLPYFNPASGVYASALSNELSVNVLETGSPEPATLKKETAEVSREHRPWIWLIPLVGLLLVVGWFWKKRTPSVNGEKSTITDTHIRTVFNWDDLLFESDDLRFVQLYYARLKSVASTNADKQYWIQYCEQYLYAGKTGPLNRQAMIDAAKSLDA
jgi:hypothetical protein